MIADDLRTFYDLRSAIVCDHMETSLKAERKVHKKYRAMVNPGGLPPYLGYTGRAAEKGMVFRPRCPKQSAEFWLAAVLNSVWYKEPRDFQPDCEQSLSFPSLREFGLKGQAIMRPPFFFFDLHNIKWIKPTALPGHYSVINQHQSSSGQECYCYRYRLI